MAIEPMPCCYAQKADMRPSHALPIFSDRRARHSLGWSAKPWDIRLEVLGLAEKCQSPTKITLRSGSIFHLLYADFAHHH